MDLQGATPHRIPCVAGQLLGHDLVGTAVDDDVRVRLAAEVQTPR